MDEKTLTFDELCEAEPELRRLYRLASMIGRKRGKDFCANFVWYSFIKPMMMKLVGDERTARPKKEGIGRFVVHKSADTLPDSFWKKRDVVIVSNNKASSCDDPVLWSSRAYDVAYHAIYDALPNCRHEGICA